MKGCCKYLLTATLTLIVPMRETVFGQAPEIRSRFIAATLEKYEGTSFKPASDSVRMHWHDTCGAGFDYSFYSWGSSPEYLEADLVGFEEKSTREYSNRLIWPFESLNTYAPVGSTGYMTVPKTQTNQVINSNNFVDYYVTEENGQAVDRMEHFYNASGDRISTKRYMATSTGVVLSYIDSFWYDNGGNLIIDKSVNMLGTTPVTASLVENTYDVNNHLIQVDASFDNGGTLSLNNSTVFSYNSSAKRTGAMVSLADPVTGVLSNYRWEGYTYNSSNQMDSRSQALRTATGWDTVTVLYQYGIVTDKPEAAYVLKAQSTDTTQKVRWFFNSEGLCDSLLYHYKYGTGVWYPIKKTTLRYNNFGQPTYMETKTGWNNTSNSWSNLNGDLRSKYYYETYNTGTDINTIRPSLAFSIYPNPVLNEVHIRPGSESIRLLTVCDLSGKVLIQKKASVNQNGEITLLLGGLPAGVYILKADGEGASSSKKIIVY